jgi:hypothetical protein
MLSATLYRFVGKVKVWLAAFRRLLSHILKWSNREPGIIFQKEIACGKKHYVVKIFFLKHFFLYICGNAERLPGNQSILPR